jgi:phytanoyl-CoA hydroxylase
MDNMMIESFRRDGYVFLPGFLDQSEIRDLDRALENVIAGKIQAMPSGHVVYEDPTDRSTLKQLQDLHLYDDFFANVLFGSRFEQVARTLLADEAIGKTVEYFNKPPLIGKETPPHQDAFYFMITPPEALTMWLALEDVDAANGCVRYVRGSHLRGMRPHERTDTRGFSQAISDFGSAGDVASEVAMPAKPGDLLIHHGMTIHRAEANKSQTRSRRAMGLIYFAASAMEDREAKEAYQRRLKEEMRSTT